MAHDTRIIRLLLAGLTALLAGTASAQVAPPVACTMEAMQCADGSYVSRTGPHCEFTPCPKQAAEAPPATTAPAGPACNMAPLRCPDGKLILPDAACHYAECMMTVMSPPHPIEPATADTGSALPDRPLDTTPIGPQNVQFVVEHRSALNGNPVTVHGIVASGTSVPCMNQRQPCPRHIMLADTVTLDRDMHYDLHIELTPVDNSAYTTGQLIEISGIVHGSKDAVSITE